MIIESLTIIVETGLVSINGIGYDRLDLSCLDEGIRVVQWYGTHGELELTYDKDTKPANIPISDLGFVQAAIDIWIDFDTKHNDPFGTMTVEEYADYKRKVINDWRNSANYSHFLFNDKKISSDSASLDIINGINGELVVTGSLPASFSMSWKAIDNSFVSIPDVSTWKALYQTMVDHFINNFNHSEVLKGQISTIIVDTTMTDAEKKSAIDNLTW